jgi:TatD DNase family protein
MNLSKTSYVGEIGLDYSRDAKNSAREQLSSFRFVMETIGTQPKFLSIHSRGAEEAVLDVLDEFGKRGAVLHWFSGSAPSLVRGLRQGHFFSVNPAMVRSPRGRKLIELMPRDRVLLETDGPFVKIGTKIVQQSDLPVVESFLSSLWATEESDVARQLTSNFTSVLSQLGSIEQRV